MSIGGEDANGGRAGEAVLLDIPAVPFEQLVPGGGEASDVGHPQTLTKANAAVTGSSQ